MLSEPLGANDAGGTFRPHRTYQLPLTLLPVAYGLGAQWRVRASDPVSCDGIDDSE
jgi:hypothetical protein